MSAFNCADMRYLFPSFERVFFAVAASIFFVVTTSFIITSGWSGCKESECGLWIAERHIHDSLWHIAIANTAFQSLPPQHPIYAGESLTHYNYFFDVLLFVLQAVARISPIAGYFQVMPIVTTPLYIGSVWFVAKALFSDRQKARMWLVTLLFFGNSFAFLMTAYSSHTLVGSSIRGFPLILSIQPITMFYNHQFALSCVFLLLAMWILHKNKSGVSFQRATVLAFLFAVLLAIKVYAGAAMLSYVGIYLFIKTLQKKQKVTPVTAFVVQAILWSGIVMVGMYGVRLGEPPTFVYDPLAFIRSIIDDPSHFFNVSIALARTYLEAQPSFSPRLVAIYGGGIVLFYLVNFGVRLVALWQLVSMIRMKKVEAHSIALWLTIIFLSVMPLLFVQAGDWFNTMQFLYYAVFFMSFLAADVLAHTKGVVQIASIVCVFIVCAIPLVDVIRLTSEPQVYIPEDTMQAANYLKDQPMGTVYTYGFVMGDSRIPALTHKQALIADIPVLKNTGIDPSDRLKVVEKNLMPNGVDYIWVDLSKTPEWRTAYPHLRPSFANKSIVILRVQ